MARREIVVGFRGETSSFRFAKVDRSKLYGRRERVVLDESGAPCTAALLTADGAALAPPGSIAHVYVDDALGTVDRAELTAVDREGKPQKSVPATLGAEQPLTTATPEEVLEHVVVSVYQLDPTSLGDALKASLAEGTIHKTGYSYRDGFDLHPLFLLQNEEGLFGLVGRPTEFEFLARTSLAEEEAEPSDEDELADDLDFSMMV